MPVGVVSDTVALSTAVTVSSSLSLCVVFPVCVGIFADRKQFFTLSTDSPGVAAWLHSVGPSWYCKRNVSAAFKQTSMTNFLDGGRNV